MVENTSKSHPLVVTAVVEEHLHMSMMGVENEFGLHMGGVPSTTP